MHSTYTKQQASVYTSRRTKGQKEVPYSMEQPNALKLPIQRSLLRQQRRDPRLCLERKVAVAVHREKGAHNRKPLTYAEAQIVSTSFSLCGFKPCAVTLTPRCVLKNKISLIQKPAGVSQPANAIPGPGAPASAAFVGPAHPRAADAKGKCERTRQGAQTKGWHTSASELGFTIDSLLRFLKVSSLPSVILGGE